MVRESTQYYSCPECLTGFHYEGGKVVIDWPTQKDEDLALNIELTEPVMKDIVDSFPHPGKFEDNIYRFSAREIHDYVHHSKETIENGQLVLEREIAPGYTALVYTSVKVGQIAGGTGDDSIRVIRRDVTDKGTFYYKDEYFYVTRRVPQDCDTVDKAMMHIMLKIEERIAALWRETDTGIEVKCKSKNGPWWKKI
jgi:hypothetical protein